MFAGKKSAGVTRKAPVFLSSNVTKLYKTVRRLCNLDRLKKKFFIVCQFRISFYINHVSVYK